MISILILQIAYMALILENAELPDPAQLPEFLPGVCFMPDNASRSLAENQKITCVLATAGQYPPRQSQYRRWSNRCCFYGDIEDGIFWAIGESVMSPVTSFESKRPILPFISQKTEFLIEEAHLVDILAVDASNDAVISNARVTISDDAVHLVSYSKKTDDDGYAVIPIPSGTTYIMTIRADGYLSPPPLYLHYTGEENVEKLVELDPGVELSGRVVDSQGTPVSGAQIHVEIERTNGGNWNSEIDLPRPISPLADGKGWNPYRGSYSTAENGKFKLETLPRGKIRIYAAREGFAPSAWVHADAEDNDVLQPVELVLQPTHHAWVRVEDAHQIAVASNITIIDDETSCEIATAATTTSGAQELKNLPLKTRFFVTSEAYAPIQTVREIHDGDEITLVLDHKRSDAAVFTILDEDGNPIPNATISLSDPDLRKLHPTCLGKTDSTGMTTLEFCPKSFWIDVFHPNYAHILQYVTPQAPISLNLNKGHAIEIEMLDETTESRLSEISCTTEIRFESGQAAQKLKESFTTSDGLIRLEHRPELSHHLICSAGTDLEISTDFEPENAPKTLKFPHQIKRNAIVVDSYGSPVPYALIQLGSRRIETDDTGRVELTGLPNAKMTIYHWQHGQAKAQFVDGASDLELRLPDTIDENTTSCLQSHSLPFIIDSSQILLDAADPKHGIVRGDAVESCNSKEMVVVRNGRRMTIRF